MKLLISKLRLVSKCQTNNVFRAMAYSNSSGKSNKIEFRSAYPSPSTLVKVSKYLEVSFSSTTPFVTKPVYCKYYFFNLTSIAPEN